MESKKKLIMELDTTGAPLRVVSSNSDTEPKAETTCPDSRSEQKSTEPATSQSPKSTSSLKARRQRRPYNPSLKRLLKRKCEIRFADGRDWPFFWAAYQEGTFATVIQPGLSVEAFEDLFSERMHAIPEFYIMDNGAPRGIIVSFSGGRNPIWHAVWFSWASKRDILACTATFLHFMRKEGIMGFIQQYGVNEPSTEFLEYLIDLGLIRRVGKDRDR